MDARQPGSSVTIALSAALLFVIQPMVAKALLPRFGGSAGVWVACMMFFQVVLLLGYWYAYWLTRFPSPRARTAVHLGLLAASLAVLPLRLTAGETSAGPMLSILLVLAASVGLPFLVLSTTSPLVQSWHAGARKGPLPYWLFAVSNTACLLALLAYPVAIEPRTTVSTQLRGWSTAYVILALMLAVGAIANRGWKFEDEAEAGRILAGAPASRPALWILAAACPSALWLAVANYLSREVAPIPFLWVLPLTLYLLTLVLCFGWEGCYRRSWFRWLLPAAWIGVASRVGLASKGGDLRVDLPVMLAALFVLAMFCHGELARTKPVPRQELAWFYLMVAAGGALGGVFVGLAAPALFSTFLELPIAVVATVLLALVLVYRVTSRGRLLRLGVLGAAAFVAASAFHGGTTRVARERNFYGALEIRDAGEGEQAVRILYNGRTVHGVEFLAPARRRMPTAYYGAESGVGLLLDALATPERRVGIVGLGAGTLAAYGRNGDSFRFFEINPAVIQAASADFHYIADSAAAVDAIRGDGRLRLEQEAPHSFDLIVLDAFSDDAIPVHLLTRDAFQVYFERLRAGAPLAIHVTNRYLDLSPVVASLAAAFHKEVLRIHSPAAAGRQVLAADWDIVTDDGGLLAKLRPYADPTPLRKGPLWTDEYSNLFRTWR